MKIFISKCVHVVGRLTNAHKMARALTLLLLAVFLQPQKASAAWDFQEKFMFNGYQYHRENNGNAWLEFRFAAWDEAGYDEGFIKQYDGLTIWASKDGGKTWEVLLTHWCDADGHNQDTRSNRGLGVSNSGWYPEGDTWWINVRWDLPKQWRDSNIEFWSQGRWSYADGDNPTNFIHKETHSTNYTHYVRSIYWNGAPYVGEDGTVTVPYSFGGACNTDGETHICTRINGSYNDAIGYKYPAGNYAAGSYSFNLSTIGMNMRSQFNIQPYHEFTHINDMDMDNNGVEYYQQNAGTVTIYPLPKATITSAVFSQVNHNVVLNWTADNTQYYGNGKWIIYRNGTKAGVVNQMKNQSDYTYTDLNENTSTANKFPYESNVKYTIYFVGNGWSETKQRSELKSNEVSVNTTRKVPVNNFSAETQDDRIVFTWTSNGYPTAMNHKFKIYIDNVLAYTLMPSNGQTNFRWEHRTTDAHSDRQNKMDGTIPYTEEPLNACAPHNYRIEGLIGETVLNNSDPVKTAIGNGTLFYSFDATKGAYPGAVKLQWHVNRQGSTDAKTYVIERRRAERETEDWATITRMSSAEDYLIYTDDTPLPGVFYDYRVTVFDKCDDGKEKEKPAYDIGFAQTTGTMSGRITFGSTGSSVANVNVEARLTGTSDEDNTQYRAMRFTDPIGEATWNYPSSTYAAKKFAVNDFSMQMWVNPETLNEAKIVRLNGETCYIGMNSEGKLTLDRGKTFTSYTSIAGGDGVGNQNYTRLIDNSNKSKWCCVLDGGGIYAEFSTPDAIIPTGYVLTTGDDTKTYPNRNPTEWKLYGKLNEGDKWTLLDSIANYTSLPATNLTDVNFNFSNSQPYKYFRFEVKAVKGYEGTTANYIFQLQEMKLRGSDHVYTFDNTVLKAGQYNHVVLTRSGQTVTASVVGTDEAGAPVLNSSTQNIDGDWTLAGATQLSLGHFVGHVDEFRIWSKALNDAEILENYDHLLVGNENNLETYWTFDEGLSKQFFDYSRDGSVYRQHHGKTGSNAGPSNLTPAQLKLRAKTDADGNYIIQGVPFRGEGTTYAVVPTLGIHQFNPTQQLRFVGNNSLVHNGTDFTDVSSFPVRGTIRYANTDYPVEGVQFYVDGQICAKEGQPITTNAYGEYEISVPIGEHYITVQKQGHEFADGGRYPADPEKVGTLVNYNDAVSGLDFEDVTLVTVAGRVTGGKIEEEKPLGFGQSVNNIGQATITLGIDTYRLNVVRNVQGTTVSYDSNASNLTVSSPTADVQSTAYRQGGDADAVKKIVIKTDPATGEFAALLPPIDYRVESIDIESNQQITFDNLPVLYANDPTKTQTDSLEVEGSPTKKFEYVAKMIQSYYTDPVLEVTQKDRADGSFGDQTYTYSDKVTPETEVKLYTVDGSDVSYTFGYPLFKQQNTYIFNVRGYETYANNDGESPVSYEVPLRDVEVTFSNQMGTGQQVVINPELTDEDDERGDLGSTAPDMVTLDEDGKGQYKWTAGLPNITAPYTLSVGATFVQNGRTYTWNGVNATNSLAGVVTGALPSGNNFVTNGPDQITMILRDPAGSASQAYWEAGSTTTNTITTEQSFGDEREEMTHTEIGFELTQFSGVGVGAISGIITNNKQMATVDVGATIEVTGETASTRTVSTTSTKRVSTSDQPEYVGAQGDLFIGQATNIIFGNARTVGLEKNDNGFALTAADNYVTGQEFATTFHYTQNHIENVMIPNFINLRNDILKKGYDEKGLLYSTTLTEDDENYGAPGTYTCTKPDNTTQTFYTDMVGYYNEQIKNWESAMAFNEEMKVKAITNRRTYLDSNQSFDSGAFIESSTTYTAGGTESYKVGFNAKLVVGMGTDITIFGQDVNVNVQNTMSYGNAETTETGYEHSVTTGYSLVETGDDDALTVDVFNAPDGMGAIFVTRGGQTTCPYEGEQKTKYYEPGKHTIATATMQIEKPAIAVENAANRVGGVPAGKRASYTLLLTNESETGEDCYFDLFTIDGTNTEGAGLYINGNDLKDGRAVLVPAGETVRMALELEQNKTGGLTYENIAIVLASQCQKDPASTWDVIGDTVYISAEFVPTSTDVALRIDNAVVNTSTKGMLPLTVKDYDPNYEGLKYIAVQYQGMGETAWHDARRYMVKEGDILNPIDEPLPKNGIINLNFDMTNGNVFPDRTYKFRALSARTYGSGEITNVSQEIQVVKDMSRPKPLGQPQPTDGILSAGDELSILFNESILNGELTKDANFRVTGVLNGSTVAHATALAMQNTAQTAATEANIILCGKDFSIDTWMNVQSAGTLLSHGTGTQKLTVGVNDDNKLVVKIGDQTYTSLNDVPQNQWSFLTLSLTQDGKLSASVATDATTTTLFKDKEVTTYEGNGPLAVGQQMTAAMHELLLWEEARDITTALQQRSVTKSPATRGLIGYWKMDEGEGMTLTDYARNRHMTMTAETWHIENENKAVTLDGSHYVGINTSEIPPMPQDDYAVELWVKAGEQTADAQLLQLGEVGLSLNADGQLQLESNNSSLFTLNSSLTDNAWHHVALSVLRGGNANVYVDGVAKASVSADKVGSLGSDMLLIGAHRTLQDVQQSEVLYTYDRPLTATIDEVRIWNASMNANLLKKQRKVRLTGDEPGLVAYYPFEVKTLNAQNQIVTNGSAADLCGSGKEAELSTLNSQLSILNYTDVAPALRVKPEEENVSFTFTASENKIVIELNEEPAKVEGCTLNFTVRDVHDLNGNLSEPATWSAFINQNPLVWKENIVSSTSAVAEGATLTATLVNKSGTAQNWTLSGLSTWLTADMDYGQLSPLEEKTVTFTISEATPIGKYEHTVYVAGNDGIETPLTLNIKVTGNTPDWAVNPHDYESSMNVIGMVKKDDVPLSDPDDILAAFIGEECRGVAYLAYNERYDNYYVTMDIYGNGSENDKEVTFRAYDASTGTIYPVVTLADNSVFKFESLSLAGTYADPKVFNIQNKIEQVIALKTGWNWISFNVTADDMTVPEIFKNIADDVETVKSQYSGYKSYENGTWGGLLTNLTNTEMYAVLMKDDCTLRVVGTAANVPVNIYQGWNWIGYQGQQVASLGNALANMEKTDGDLLKAQRGVAYWDDFEWSGSLLMMQPGLGYQLKSNTNGSLSRNYSAATRTAESKVFLPVNFRLYPDNAIMAAKVVANGQPVANAELAVFAADECRTAAVTNEEGIAYITIPGDEACELTFKAAVSGEMISLPLTINYETDAIYGTPKHPVVIDLGNATGIREISVGMGEESIYDLSGRKVRLDDQTRKLHKGVYIINGQKKTVK